MKSQLSVSSHSDMVIDEWMAILCRIVESKWIKGGSIWSRGGRSLKNWLVASGVPLLFDWPGIFYVPDVPEEGGMESGTIESNIHRSVDFDSKRSF